MGRAAARVGIEIAHQDRRMAVRDGDDSLRQELCAAAPGLGPDVV